MQRFKPRTVEGTIVEGFTLTGETQRGLSQTWFARQSFFPWPLAIQSRLLQLNIDNCLPQFSVAVARRERMVVLEHPAMPC